MRLVCTFSLFFLSFVLAPLSVQASTLSKVLFTPDNSLNPPGDEFRVRVYLEPGEKRAEIQIRPILLTTENNQEKLTPLQAEVKTLVERPAESKLDSLVIRDLIIPFPYASLKLPVGDHRLAYELRLFSGDRLDFIGTSWVTMVRVTAGTRTWMFHAEIVPAKPVKTTKTVTVVDADGKFHEKEIASERIPRYMVYSAGDAKIPGEYLRFVTGQFVYNFPPGYKPKNPTYYLLDENGNPILPRDDNTAQAFHQQQQQWQSRQIATPEITDQQNLRTRAWVPAQNKRIYYATNRNVVKEVDTSERYGDELSDHLSYGSSLVNIPLASHSRGSMETPSFWDRNDVNKYFSFESLKEMSKASFLNETARPLSEQKQDILLLVHGFNNTFEFVNLRMAQLVQDIQFPGTPVVFSWPSEGSASPDAYERDEKKAEVSYSALVEVLKLYINQIRAAPDPTKAGKIHIIAHSMGNRILLRALRELRDFLKPGEKPFGHIVLAAPDISVDQFVAWFPSASKTSESVSLYYCAQDKALKASRTLHMDRRAGEAPIFTDGLDNIDAGNANTSFLGHDYFVSRSELLVDIELSIVKNLPPPRRPTIHGERTDDGFDYWEFP